jgi:predicted lipid-binding transport protein (Tim44 family)
MKQRTFLAVIALAVASILIAQAGDAWARVSSGGSRGSRSFSAPARPSPTPSTPTSPSRTFSQPSPVSPSPMPQRPSFFGGLMGGIAGFALGGLLGSLLFGGFGHGLGGFGGIGLMEIILIGGALFLLFRFLRRRQEAPEPAYAAGYGTAQAEPSGWGAPAAVETPAGSDHGDLDRGVAYVRQMDPGFDPAVFAERVRTEFTNIQSVLAVKDADVLRDRLTPEMYTVLKGQCEALRAAGRTDYVQKVDVERSDVTEAWQESGQDFVTVYFVVSMIDYTLDDRTGQVVEGSRTEPQRVEEFWTFTRPVGPNRWKLSAIQPV